MTERNEDLTKTITFTPAFDKRSDDPKKNYGVHAVEMRWVVRGRLGAIQFLMYTGWHLPHVAVELRTKQAPDFSFEAPIAADLGYHSPVPRYADQKPMSRKCDILGGTCYYDGSGLHAQPIMDMLIEKGGDAVWDELCDYYRSTFIADCEVSDESNG